MTFPLPLATALLAGLFTLAGVWIASQLTSSREHRRWVSDNKKLEWRELIDQMHESLNRMHYAFDNSLRAVDPGDDSFDPAAGMFSGYRVLRNRIFIVDALEQHGLIDQWEELVKYVNRARRAAPSRHQEEPTMAVFNEQARAFEKGLLDAARIDVGVVARRRWFHRSTTRGQVAGPGSN